MKILYFHQHFSTPQGSAGIRSYQMARRLVDQGHDVTIVCGSYNAGATGLTDKFRNGVRRGSVEGIDVIEYDLRYSNSDGFLKRSFTFLKFAVRSTGLVFTESYDLVFATTTPLTAGIPGIVARWFRRKTFVFEVRDLWPELPKAMGIIRNPLILGAMSVLEWMSYRSAHRCIGLSPGIVEGIARRGVSMDRIALVPNGCDLDIFSGAGTPWRPDDVNNDDLMAVFTGTHGPANGLDAVLDVAHELLLRNRTDIKFVLVGDGKVKPELKRRSQDLQLNNVIFHEPVPKHVLSGLMSSADIGMQVLANVPAFYYGTSPNKFFDYIAAGLPVINNYPGWLKELIDDNRCGYSVPPENPVAFADALEDAADNRLSLREMGDRACDLAVRCFDRQRLSEKWVSWVVEGSYAKADI